MKKDWKKFVKIPIVIIDPFCREELKHREVRQPARAVTASPRLSTRSGTGTPNPGFPLESLDSFLDPKGWVPLLRLTALAWCPWALGVFKGPQVATVTGQFADHCSRASG